MADALHAYDEMSVGRVFARGFGVIADNPLTVFAISIIGVIPSVATTWYEQIWRQTYPQSNHLLSNLGVNLAASLIRLAIQAVIAGALVRATLAHARGERATIGECVQASLPVALPLVGLSLLEGIAIGFGMILLLVPGVILWVMWSVATPALVAERTGITKALGRSADLTKGVRWQVFGIQTILIIGGSIFSGAYLAALFASTGLNFGTLATSGIPLAWLVASSVSGAALIAVAGTVHAALYVELRNWKEGLPEQSLAQIFA